MFEIEEIVTYFKTKLFVKIFTNDTKKEEQKEIEEDIRNLYFMISNPQERVNSDDKMWVACSDTSEMKITNKAIKKILEDNSIKHYTENEIICACNEACKIFEKKGITHKPRIPLYILALDGLV